VLKVLGSKQSADTWRQVIVVKLVLEVIKPKLGRASAVPRAARALFNTLQHESRDMVVDNAEQHGIQICVPHLIGTVRHRTPGAKRVARGGRAGGGSGARGRVLSNDSAAYDITRC